MTSSLRLTLSPVITAGFRVWWRFSRGATLGVRGLATDAEGRVLLVRHTYRPGWFLPGGGVESGETAVEAATREMMEEGGVEATAPPRLIGFYANHASFKNDHVALYAFEAWRPCAFTAHQEIAERGFFPRDALPEGVTEGTRRRLAEAFEGRPPSPHW